MACPPPRRPVMTVSATQEASDAATAASAALPPSCRISIPASTVCGCPAATPAGRAEGAIPVATLLPTEPRPSVSFLHGGGDSGVADQEVSLTLTKEAKQDIISKHGRSETDTGSAQVQIALLTTRINQLSVHHRN